MIIKENLLISHGAEHVEYKEKQTIFREGCMAKFYYQVIEGFVELNTQNDEGREFTHNILSSGQCLGESFLFNEKPYPMTAIAQTDCKIIKLHKTAFLDLLRQNPEVSFNLFKSLADKLYYKYIMLSNISLNNPAQQLQTLMNYFQDYNFTDTENPNQVPLTRKQLANLTGLRVETVIRTVKKMEKEQILKIENRKIYYSKLA
jgi:CRP-like cAMP-binding protein